MAMTSFLRSWLGRSAPRRAPTVARRRARPQVEALETRAVPAGLVVSPEVNTGHMAGSQSETAIAIDPVNPQHIAVETNDNASNGGMYYSLSTDGGATWRPRVIANGGADGLPNGFTDPSLAWDRFGNLFMSYINSNGTQFTIALSTDGGTTFKVAATIACQDQPHLAVGAGEVAAVCNNGSLQVSSARVTGLGAVGAFSTVTVPNSNGQNFGGISIGPNGQITVCSQTAGSGVGPDNIKVSTDLTGVGGAFSNPTIASPIQVGGFRPIPAQSQRTVDSESKVLYDDSNGPHRGRLYLVYTDAPNTSSNSLNIFLRYSDNNGATWTAPKRVNDDSGINSHFFSSGAVDPITGNLAVAWYDCRNSPTNTQVECFATASLDGGVTFLPNVQVATGLSNSNTNHNSGNDYGDFMTTSFYGGVFYPCWVDNSATLPGNTDRPQFDIATARVTVPAVSASSGQGIAKLFYPLRYIYNPVTGLYTGTLTLTNIGTAPLKGPATLIFTRLPPEVTLVNATGYSLGVPFIKVFFTSLEPNQSIQIPVVFTDPLNIPLSTFFMGFPIVVVLG